MLTAYWAAKGGAGATVLAAAHALHTGQDRATVLVDLDGDLPAVLGLGGDTSTGVADWLAAGTEVPADALERLSVPVTGRCVLLPRGAGPLATGRAGVLARLLAAMPADVIVDAGTRPGPTAQGLIRAADRSVLVTRACYLAVRRAATAGLAPTEVVLVAEPQRALDAAAITEALGTPVRARVAVDPAVARAVDSGLLAARTPRRLSRAVAALAR